MPVHTFEDRATGATVDVYVSANAPTAEHQTQVLNGVTYKRVYAVPLAAVDMGTRLGDASAHDFERITATTKRGLKVGDAWEISAEMSAKRAQRDGKDAVRERWYAEYEKRTKDKHPDVKQREALARANAQLAEMGMSINP